jgi:hypothetical protein
MVVRTDVFEMWPLQLTRHARSTARAGGSRGEQTWRGRVTESEMHPGISAYISAELGDLMMHRQFRSRTGERCSQIQQAPWESDL